MLSSIFVSALIAASTVQAAPFFGNARLVVRADSEEVAATPYKEAADKSLHYTSDVTIHETCNASQAHFLRRGLEEMKLIAVHAHDRILSKGEEDPLYKAYFGNASSASTSGYYAQLAYGNKAGVLFRCDDPDLNCATQVSAKGPWAGHHRGKNATLETVICPPTFTARKPLDGLCWDPAAQIGDIPVTLWLATDLMHRLTHIPAVTYDNIHHAADTYPDMMALAAINSPDTAFNSDGYQYYALDAYARDVAFPPNGCISAAVQKEADEAVEAALSGATETPVSSSAPTATATGAATSTSSAAQSCHTHADGVIHCG